MADIFDCYGGPVVVVECEKDLRQHQHGFGLPGAFLRSGNPQAIAGFFQIGISIEMNPKAEQDIAGELIHIIMNGYQLYRKLINIQLLHFGFGRPAGIDIPADRVKEFSHQTVNINGFAFQRTLCQRRPADSAVA